MINSIFIALTGLHGYERGLQVIANNTANLNTPGFKGSSLLFADMYFGGGGLSGPGTGGYGLGLNTLGTLLSFQQGQFQSTSSGLDLAIDGLGLFTVRDAAGQVRYTRDGQFKFNEQGVLVTQSEEEVLAFDAQGALGRVSIDNLRLNVAAVTTRASFGGNLTTGSASQTVSNVTVYDRAGTAHTLSVRFDAVTGTNNWTVTVLDSDGTTAVGTGPINFNNGLPVAGEAFLDINYAVTGQDRIPIRFDFSTNVTSYGSGTTTTLAMTTQDGHAPGSLTGTAFDDTGTLVLSYSNGQTVRGVRLALARFDSLDAVRALGDNRFEAVDLRAWSSGYAGSSGFGKIKSSMVEMSNVDLSSEFSDLVIMQRGYQASSQVVSTANEMLAELFGMKGK